MRARTLILLIVALVLAGGTTMMARVWLASQRAVKQEAAPIAVPTPSKSVLIARSTIQRGQILRPDDLAWEPWPEGGIDKNYILLGSRTPETYAGWVARQPIAAGEPLIESKIVAPGNRGFLAAVLHPGMRAISVPVTVTSGIAGFVFPGDQVDLIVTYSVQDQPRPDQTNPGPLMEHKVAETVLHDLRVIAIDQKLESKAGEATVAKTATLEVTPKQSEVIALASEMGKLSLSLRSLVPGPNELKQEVADPSPGASPLLAETYTVDSDVSPLLRRAEYKPAAKTDKKKDSDGNVVTILRGNSGQNTTVSSAQASDGQAPGSQTPNMHQQ
jgi:pilus assembly protein CpaB